MLVSPLMGPILSLTFGIAVLKKSIVSRSMRNEVIGVVISVLVGFVCGFAQWGISGNQFNPGDEMLNRGRGVTKARGRKRGRGGEGLREWTTLSTCMCECVYVCVGGVSCVALCLVFILCHVMSKLVLIRPIYANHSCGVIALQWEAW